MLCTQLPEYMACLCTPLLSFLPFRLSRPALLNTALLSLPVRSPKSLAKHAHTSPHHARRQSDVATTPILFDPIPVLTKIQRLLCPAWSASRR